MFPPALPPLAPLPPVVDPVTASYVRIRRVAGRISGKVGGRQILFGDWSVPIPVSLKGVKRGIGVSDMRTQMREHLVTNYEVVFTDEPFVGLRDQLSWDETGKLLTVTGVMPVGDPGTRAWCVFAEEDEA